MSYKYNQSNEREFKVGGTFKTIPKGFIIFDTYNNKWFPIKTVQIDNNMYNLRIIKDDFHRQYGGSSTEDLFMPWHYTVEFIGKSYNVSLTRPVMYKSLIPGYEDYISICLMGDSSADMYTKDIYQIIAHLILNSYHYIPGWRLNLSNSDLIEYHNLGESFKTTQLKKYLK